MLWYYYFGTAVRGRRFNPLTEGNFFCPLILGEEGCIMVTYEALFAYTAAIVGVISLTVQIIALVIQLTKKK